MRPIKLTIQAFGPYAGVEEINFSDLGNRTMFVISGKTGSGKTTIFDAISYAIYGKASGEDRTGPELRSQFAKEDVITEVSLDFSLRGKIYSITRSPQQQKKKEKSDGYTTISAKAELYIWDESGSKKLIASKVSEVEEKIKEIMLIDANQFRQILMIPQGEFRKLLTSDSKDKEVILQRLFHTQIYKLIEEKLKEEAAELKRTIEGQLNTRNDSIRQIAAVFNEELKGYLAAGSVNDVIILPLVKEEIAQLSAVIDQLTAESQEKQNQHRQLLQQISEAERILKQIQTKAELQQQKQRLEEQQSVYTEKEQQVRLARKAAILGKQEELCHRLKREADHFQRAVTTISGTVSSLDDQVRKRELEFQQQLDKENERQRAADRIFQLESIKDGVYSFEALENELGRLTLLLSTAKAKQQRTDEQLQNTEENMKSKQAKMEEIERGKLVFLETDRQIDKLTVQLEQISRLETSSKRQIEAKSQSEAAAGRFQKASASYMDAKELVEQMEQTWIAGQASLLAQRLKEGEECPVCGSLHHPSPAESHHEAIPTEEELQTAKNQLLQLEREKSTEESALYKCQSAEKSVNESVVEQLAEIRKLQPDFQMEYLHAEQEAITRQKTDLEKSQKQLQLQINQLDNLKTDLVALETAKRELQELQRSVSAEVMELTIQHTERQAELNNRKGKIPENLRTAAAYENALATAKKTQENLIKQLEKAQELLQTARESHARESAGLTAARDNLKSKLAELESERGIFKSQLAEQGFNSFAVYENAKLSPHEAEQIEQEIRNFREELRSVTDRYTEITELLRNIEMPDLNGLNIAAAKLDEELEALGNQRTDYLIKRQTNEDIYQRIEALNAEVKMLEERYRLIGSLSDMAKGQNTYRMTFERFVLAAFLDDILAEANGRLRKMTSGRYILLRKKDRSKGNVQSGLELLVFDQYTGQERHVKTLSGGESFKAALSLALGLADVVQNYAGGVSLETMFIDEGFGTLDPESLDQAIEALMDIQSSGRLVGIISHVPELKERIDARLEVVAEQTGSRTEFVFSS